jgi:hypothetical protein
MNYVFNWRETGEGRNFVLDGPENMIALVYREDSRSTKRLNKETRKYESVITAEKWIAQTRLDFIKDIGIYNTPAEARDRIERWITSVLDTSRKIIDCFNRPAEGTTREGEPG